MDLSTSGLSQWWQHWLQTIWPEPCFNCGCPGELSPYGLCHSCQSQVIFWHNNPGSQLLHAVVYDGVMKRLICDYKYKRKKFLAPKLARLIAEVLSQAGICQPEAIVPVPLFWWRELVRGFNQMALVGLYLEQFTGIPLFNNVLAKHRQTISQTNLTGSERKKNVRGSFSVRHDRLIKDRYLLLIDDVYTTGATTEEAVRCLKKAGAKAVTVVTVARSAD